ncbi:MAG: TraB/GumN family protein [Aliivibrio sp.]|uniref:TraB/GumN family protein n=1 Tax=Aliivibrio sp. TaxID=1872443 RepID=UPI001A47B146|nr:TraB/GumN family protein [Aliivibrio sp.]
MKLSLLPFFLIFTSLLSIAEPSVWRAEKAGFSYTLLGSIHAGKGSFYPLPNSATKAFESSHGLIVEADILSNTAPILRESNFSAIQVLSNQKIEQLHAILTNYSLNIDSYLQLPPWLLAMTLQLLQLPEVGLQVELGIDQFFLQQAHQNSTPVHEFEGMDFQISLFQNLEQEGADLLIDTIEGWSESQQALTCLVDAWQQGDDGMLVQLLEQQQYNQQLADLLIYKRNNQWVNALVNNRFQLIKGEYLVVVGALHLVGNKGIISQLERNGFTVERLTPIGYSNCKVAL